MQRRRSRSVSRTSDPPSQRGPVRPDWSRWGEGQGATAVEPVLWEGNPAQRWDAEESEAAEPWPVYLMLSRLTNQGRRALQMAPQRILEINHEVEQHGCEIIAQFALLGAWDFATVIKAKDNLTIHAVARDLAAHGDLKTMTMPAIPLAEFIEEMKKGLPSGPSQ